MKKEIKKYLIIILILLIYFVIGKITGFYIPCPIHKITGLYCPGCGITRMFIYISKLDFYHAFRSNMLLFILFPFALLLFIDNLYSIVKNKRPYYQKINNKVWYILIIILVIYGILRNIFPILAPL